MTHGEVLRLIMASSDTPNAASFPVGRPCLRAPTPELLHASDQLNAAVSAHFEGDRARAADLIAATNTQGIRDWVESLWGADSPYRVFRHVPDAPPVIPRANRGKAQMPDTNLRRALHERDGYHCRFCGLPVIRAEVRRRVHREYPSALPWGRTNAAQHAAFQAMWAQYDHVLPFSRGGANDLSNLVVTCAPCNFGRMEYTVEELGLADPLLRMPARTAWDGLERFR